MHLVGGGHDEGAEVFGLEDDDVVIILLPLVVIVTLGEEVSLLVESTGFVSEYEVVFSQFGHPACLSSVQLLRLLEVLEVLVICPDFHIFGGSHEVVAPFRQGEHDGE